MRQLYRHTILYALALSTVLCISSAKVAQAIPANPTVFPEVQPNGKKLKLRLKGDEWFHYEETLDGYTVIKDRGWFVYAKRDRRSGKLVSTRLRVGIDSPVGRVLPGETPSTFARSEIARRLGVPMSAEEEVRRSRSRRIAFASQAQAAGSQSSDGASTAPELAGVSTSGSLKNLVVMIRWSDHSGRTLPSVADVNVLMNNNGPHALAPTGSVRDVYLENSYGALAIDSVVTDWVDSNNTESYYADGSSGLITTIHGAIIDALNKVDQSIDFRDFDSNGDGIIDAITILHSGYGAEWGGNDSFGTPYANRIWSHKWSIWPGWTSEEGITVSDYHISPAVWGTSGSSIGRIGVIAHETGHFLGLPDLYDTDSNGSGIGSYGLMANSWGFDGSQFYPPHFSPWSKIVLGWTTPMLLDSTGSYTLNQAESSSQVYKITQGYPEGEYLLIENRQPVGFDSKIPQGGLAIWHIDEAAGFNAEGYPVNGSWTGDHYRVSLLQADGAYNLERGDNRGDSGDLWHANGNPEIGVSDQAGSGPFPNTDAYQGNNFSQSNNRIFNISTSSTEMSFSYQIIGEPVTPPATPSSLLATAVGNDQVVLTWIDESIDETGFIVERSIDGLSFDMISSLSAESETFTDTGLAPNTTYNYRVYAVNAVGNSEKSNVASATTEPPPPPPSAPEGLIAQATSDSTVSLTWTDTSDTETSFEIYRSLEGVNWTLVSTVAANTTGLNDSGLEAETTYYYQVSASNDWGSNTSEMVTATTEATPSFVDHYANSEIAVGGSVSGSVSMTFQEDGVNQQISEIESGGKPSRRTSYLEHRWQFDNVRGGLAITAMINAGAPNNSEQDHFRFEVSYNGGAWSPILTVLAGTPNGTAYSAQLPSSLSGSYTLRVIDTDRTIGYRSLDSVFVDQLILRTDLDPNDSPPTPPSGLVATAVSSSRIDLAWNDQSDNERGFNIYRSSNGGGSFVMIASLSPNRTSYSDVNVAPNSTYVYMVEAFTTSFTDVSNTATASTPDGLALSLSGYKRRGKAIVDLTWIGGGSAAQVEILRSVNGGSMVVINRVSHNAGGSYSDVTGLGGSNTFIYQVCTPADLGSVVCSESSTIVF